MPKYIVDTSKGKFVINSDREPTEQEILSYIDGNKSGLGETLKQVGYGAMEGVLGTQPEPKQISESNIFSKYSPQGILTNILAGATREPMEVGKEAVKQLPPPATGGQAMARTAGYVLPMLAEAKITNVPKSVKDITGKTISRAASKLGTRPVAEEIAPRMERAIRSKLTNFGDDMVKYSKKLGVRDKTINAIKKYGFERVSNAEVAEDLAEKAYKEAWKNIPTGYGKKIDARYTLKTLNKALRNIDKKIIDTDPVYKRLSQYRDLLASKQPAPGGFYRYSKKTGDFITKPTNKILERTMPGKEKLTQVAEEVLITPDEFNAIKDGLSRLYREAGSDTKVFSVIDSMYTSAEKSGIKGINTARKLFREAKEIRQVANDMAKFDKVSADKIYNDIISVRNDPGKRTFMIDKYRPFLGKEAESIFNQAARAKTKETIGKAAIGLAGAGLGAAFGLPYLARRRGE